MAHRTHPPLAQPATRVIAGYLFVGNAPADVSDVDASRLTHINYAFANLRDGEVVEGFASDAENFRRLRELRQRHPHLRVLVAVGGWTWSGGFSDAALTVASRERFVRSAVAFVQRHDLDGLDIDWEYPGLPGNGNTHRPEDKANFTAMMAALRAGLDDLGRRTGRRYLLTFAAGAFPRFIEHTELAQVAASIDWVNLMTYDFRVAAVDPVAGHHANLFDHPDDDKRRSGDAAVREFLAAGVPAAKLVLGVPFYGRGWMDVRADRNGLYQPGVPLVDAKRIDLRDGWPPNWSARTGTNGTGTRRRSSRTCGMRHAGSSSPTTIPSRSAARRSTSSSADSPASCTGSTGRIGPVPCCRHCTNRSTRAARSADQRAGRPREYREVRYGATGAASGLTFWLTRKKLVGSYLRLTSTSLS